MIPESIVIKGFVIPIRFVKHLYRERSLYDYYSTSEMSIELDSSMSDQRREFALCHAIIIAIEDIYLIQFDENVIIDLSVALHDVIKNNRLDFDNDLPDFIKLFGCNIEINSKENLIQDYARFGSYSTMDMNIDYDISMSLQKQWLMACHETVECIKDIYSLDLTEVEIQIIATSIYDIFKNKRLIFDS